MEHSELSDTHPKVEQIQMELLRKASFAKRFGLMAGLTHFARSLSRQAIARANPNLDEEECDLLFAEHIYGTGLVDRIREYKRRRKEWLPPTS